MWPFQHCSIVFNLVFGPRDWYYRRQKSNCIINNNVDFCRFFGVLERDPGRPRLRRGGLSRARFTGMPVGVRQQCQLCRCRLGTGSSSQLLAQLASSRWTSVETRNAYPLRTAARLQFRFVHTGWSEKLAAAEGLMGARKMREWILEDL